VRRRKSSDGIGTRGPINLWDKAWQVPVYGPGGARRRGGVNLACCSCAEREKASGDTAGRSNGLVKPPGRDRENAEAATGGTEYRCAARRRTGP